MATTLEASKAEASDKIETVSSWPRWKRLLNYLGFFRNQELAMEWIGIDALPDTYGEKWNPRSTDVIASEIAIARAKVSAIELKFAAAAGKTLKIEEALLEDLEQEKKRLIAEVEDQISDLEFELGATKLDCLYRRLDLSFLSRRKWSAEHRCALPLFAFFAVDDPICKITVRYGYYGKEPFIESTMTPEALVHFNLQELQNMLSSDFRDISISARFHGAIPDRIRKKIAEASNEFQAIYIVAEAPDWKFDQVTSVAPADPLVIGKWGGAFWLIDSFDTTANEQYVASEFTSRIQESQ